MNNITISIFGNQIFLDILNELKLFSEYKIKFFDNFSLCIEDAVKGNSLVILFATSNEVKNNIKVNKYNFPLILVTHDSDLKNLSSNEFYDKINMPFNLLSLKKKNNFTFSKI